MIYHSYYNKWELSHIPNLTVMIMYCFHNNGPIHFTIIKDLQMIDLKFAFRSMIDRSGFDRSDRSCSRIVWPLLGSPLHSLYTKFHLPRPVFHSPGQIFTRIGEWVSASFPAWCWTYWYIKLWLAITLAPASASRHYQVKIYNVGEKKKTCARQKVKLIGPWDVTWGWICKYTCTF